MRHWMINLCIVGLCFMTALTGCSEGEFVTTEGQEISSGEEEESTEEEKIEEPDSKKAKEESKEGPKEIVVYVCGNVQYPGVYRLTEGDRVVQAISKAGGMTENAAKEFLNQADLLSDGDKIYVPGVDEVDQVPFSMTDGQMQEEGKINLNTASVEELMELPGIGKVRAKAIVDYRQEKGSFQSVEEVQNIEGIKGKVFEQIVNEVVVK